MTLSSLLVQLLNGLAGASTLFLVAVGLSLIFGVTRIVNFAHGSFYMLGIYIAYTAVQGLGPVVGFWPACCWRRWPSALVGGWSRCCCCAASTTRPSCSSCWPPLRWCW
jgi:branched-subunit amino acid ABC-type transport system permease component